MRRTRKLSSDLSAGSSPGGAVEGRKAIHKEVLEAILGGIASGRLRSGEQLPTEAELSKTFGASRTTIAKALRELKERGLIHRRRGVELASSARTEIDSHYSPRFSPKVPTWVLSAG